MKILVVIAILAAAPVSGGAQDSAPSPDGEAAAKPVASPSPATTVPSTPELPPADSSKLKEEVNLADTESAESMEIPVPADEPNPDKAGVLTGKLPGDDGAPEPPPATGTVEVTAKDNGKTVNATVGNLVRITLESNPSTGYNWELRDFDYAAAIFNSSDLVARKSGNVLMGAPGDTIIVLQAVELGSQQITAVYRRPWEAPDQVAATFSFQLEVDAPPSAPAP